MNGGFKFNNDNNNSNNNINKQSLIVDLTKYRNIQLVTKELGLKNKRLSKYISDLEHQKKILENYVNFILAILFNLGDLHSLLKKINIALEYPKILLIYIYLLIQIKKTVTKILKIITILKNHNIKLDKQKKEECIIFERYSFYLYFFFLPMKYIKCNGYI